MLKTCLLSQKCAKQFVHFCCRAPQGARGLKYEVPLRDIYRNGRAPQGARGLKWARYLPRGFACGSRPARGAWIEIRPPHRPLPLTSRRAPQGARGLKSCGGGRGVRCKRSRPARGAWIEISEIASPRYSPLSRPARGAWIEITRYRREKQWSICRAPQGARGLKSLH